MKFILQNIFGSFFRSLGRIFAYLFIGLIIFILISYFRTTKIKAASVETNFFMSDEIMSAYLRKCNNSDCSNNSNIALENTSFYSYLNSSAFSSISDNYGYIAKIRFDQALFKNYTYTLSLGVCTTSGSITGSTRSNFTVGDSIESYNSVSILGRNTNSIGGIEYRNGLETLKFSDCLVFQYAFVPSENSNYINVPFNLNSRSFSKFNFAILSTGVIQDLGSYTSVSNDQIMNSLDKQMIEINETKKMVEDTNNYIKDDTPPDSDISGLGNVQGLLPPGPVDSLINIPFMFTSTVVSSLSGSCKPISSKFIYDSTFSLPCYREIIYENMDGAILNWISLVPSAFILISYFRYLYKKVERATSLETNSDDEWGVV